MARDRRVQHGRRRLVQGGLGLAGLGLLAGCGLAPVSRLWGHGARRIGVLLSGTSSTTAEHLSAFRAGLVRSGTGGAQDGGPEARHADGKLDALPTLAA